MFFLTESVHGKTANIKKSNALLNFWEIFKRKLRQLINDL